jgi:two-component system sensor histidine kinase QseC
MALTVSAVAGVVMIAGGVSLFFALRLALRSQFDDTLRTKADALVIASVVDDGELEIDLDVQAFAGFGESSPGDYFEIHAADGTVLARSPSLGTASLPPLGSPPDPAEGVRNCPLPEGRDGRAYWRRFTPADDTDHRFSGLKIIVASDRARLKRTLQPIATTIAMVGAGGIVVILSLLGLVVRRGLRPLDRLGADVQRIDVARLSSRLSLDDLPVELRGMAGKLNELRTPLAELKAMTELGATWPEEFTAGHVSEMLEVISELEALIEKLSLLARAETGGPGSIERIDLEESIHECLSRQKLEIASRNLEVDCRIEPGEFLSDPVLWRAIVHNLIDNAVAYAPAGSTIGISASPRSLSVSNDAPGLAEEDLDKLFERFWRKDGPRSGTKHSGLGLSIVRSSAEFLGGACEAMLESGRLTVLVIWKG